MTTDIAQLWPPPPIEIFTANIEWHSLLGGVDEEHDSRCDVFKNRVATAMLDTDPMRQMCAHHGVLEMIIPQETEWLGHPKMMPFLFTKGTNFSSYFKGMGTNSLEYAKRYCLYALAAHYWNASCSEKFGTQFMVKNIAMALRCYYLSGDQHLKTKRSELDPDASNKYYYNMAKVMIDLTKYNVTSKPPAQCNSKCLIDLISLLNSTLSLLEDVVCPSKQLDFYKQTKSTIMKELSMCCGVYMLHEVHIPFSSTPHSAYVNVKDTARLYAESYACLCRSGKGGEKYMKEIKDKMESGYATEYRGDPSYYKIIATPAFWTNRAPIVLLSDIIVTDTPKLMQQKIYTHADIL